MATKTSPSVPAHARFVTRGSITRSIFAAFVQPAPSHAIDLLVTKHSPTAIHQVVEVKASPSYSIDHTLWEGIYQVQRRLLRASLKTSEVRRRSFDAKMLAFVIFDASIGSGELCNFEGPSPWAAFDLIHPEPPLQRRLWSKTASDESSLRNLITIQERAQRLASLSPARRKTFERIAALRDSIGPVDFDISDAIREMREDA